MGWVHRTWRPCSVPSGIYIVPSDAQSGGGAGVELLAPSPNINCVSDKEKVNFRVLEYGDLSYIYKPLCCTLLHLTFKTTLWLSKDPALDIRRWVHQGSVISPWTEGAAVELRAACLTPGAAGLVYPLLGGRQGEHVLQKTHRHTRAYFPRSTGLQLALDFSSNRPCHITPYPQ